MTQTFYGCASITDSQRIQILNKDWSQGPASYKPKLQDSSRIPKWTLKPKIEETSCFAQSLKNKNPGPGDYNPYKNQEQKYDSDTSHKNKIHQNNLINKSLKQQKERQLQRRQKQEASRAHEKILKKNSSMNHIKKDKQNINTGIKIGHSFGYRDDVGHVFSVSKQSPGPVYNVSKDFMKKSGCKWGGSFETNKNSNLSKIRQKEGVPGPGSYSNDCYKTTNMTGFFIGRSIKHKQEKTCTGQDLGPNSYKPRIPISSKTCTFKGKYQVSNIKQSYTPSPGSYEIKDTISKKGTIFSRNSRVIQQKQMAELPSPFCYDPPTSSLKEGGYSLGQRLKVYENKINNPGPGAYEAIQEENLSCMKSKHGYNKSIGGYMGRKNNDKKKLSRSYDNFYKYNPNINAVNYQSPKFSFGKGRCGFQNTQNESKLGPGSYNYEENSPEYKLKNPQGQSYTIPKNPRFKQIAKQSSAIISKVSRESETNNFGYMPKYLLSSKTAKNLKTNPGQSQIRVEKNNYYQLKSDDS